MGHPVRAISRQFGDVNARYRGFAQNRVQFLLPCALGNLFLT